MVSGHQRNVRAMQGAPKCRGVTASNKPCRNTAISGKLHCRLHGGKGSRTRTYRQQLTDYSKANLERDARTESEIRAIDRIIRMAERRCDPEDIAAELRSVRVNLRTLTQQRQADLAAAYRPPPGDLPGLSSSRQHLDAHEAKVIRDGARGALLGLAVGEAVGMTADGFERDSFREIGDMLGGGRQGLKPGQWGANTATALALLESLTFRSRFDPVDLAERLQDMLTDGVYSCSGAFDGGDDVLKQSLARFGQTRDPLALDPREYSGSLVRSAPVAIRYWDDEIMRRAVAMGQSRTTHPAPLAVAACGAFADLLGQIIGGKSLEDALANREATGSASLEQQLEGRWRTMTRSEVVSDSNVVNALGAALWCVGRSGSFEKAVLLAANLGGDCGTIAALTGQLAGALYGVSGIRSEWLERLAWKDRILESVDELLDQSDGFAGSGRRRSQV